MMADSKTAVRSSHDDSPSALPTDVASGAQGVDMEHYRATVPRWKRIWQHSLTQMMLLSVQAFCGPAMSDAIAGESYKLLKSSDHPVNCLFPGLGGGGLATPQVSNISTAIRYAMLATGMYMSRPGSFHRRPPVR